MRASLGSRLKTRTFTFTFAFAVIRMVILLNLYLSDHFIGVQYHILYHIVKMSSPLTCVCIISVVGCRVWIAPFHPVQDRICYHDYSHRSLSTAGFSCLHVKKSQRNTRSIPKQESLHIIKTERQGIHGFKVTSSQSQLFYSSVLVLQC